MSPESLREIYDVFESGDLDRAEALCQTMVAENPDHLQSALLMAAIRNRQGARSAALAGLTEFADRTELTLPQTLDVVRAMQRLDAHEMAARLIARLDVGLPEVRLAEARNAWLRGRYTRALDAFRSLAETQPGWIDAQLAYVRSLMRLGHTSAAVAVMAEALRRFPDHPALWELRALCALDQGHALGDAFACATRAAQAPGAGARQRDLAAVLGTLVHGGPLPPAVQDRPGKPLIECFDWVRAQTGGDEIRWFGSSTGLLHWAANHAPARGLVVECGVYQGLTIKLLAEWRARDIHGFDSFEGLPEDWKPGEAAGSYSTGGRLPEVPGGVTLYPGWFEDTLPEFTARTSDPVALLHVDCDVYSSTRTVLDHLGERMAPGGLIVFDDFLAYPGYRKHEFRAAHEFFAVSGACFRLVGAVLLGRSVAYERS